MMKYLALRLFGAALASQPGAALLRWYAERTPHRHLHDLDGSLYMGRWRVVDEGTFGSRLLQRLTGYSSARLHLIMRADHDRELHNHPFDYRTFIVRGWYSESYQSGLYGKTFQHAVHAGGTGTGSANKFHRISAVSPGGVLTLFFMTPNRGQWGFNVAGEFKDSVRYLLRKGYRREHVEEAHTL
jgi:hypothetical protein